MGASGKMGSALGKYGGYGTPFGNSFASSCEEMTTTNSGWTRVEPAAESPPATGLASPAGTREAHSTSLASPACAARLDAFSWASETHQLVDA